MRVGRCNRLKPGSIEDYDRCHREVWPEVLAAIARAGIRNYTIFRQGTTLFSYFEVGDLEMAAAILDSDEACQRWQALMGPLMDVSDELAPWEILAEVFHTG